MLSQKTKYALKALLYLAQQKEGEIAKTIAISEGANIPKKFLEQILLDLKRAHFVGSKQGKLGGYYLLKSKHDITLADIHRLFDGAAARALPRLPESLLQHDRRGPSPRFRSEL